jgi:thiamine-phosphate pyrophosphorylase
MKHFDLSLYLVLDPVLCGEKGMVETARAAAAGGATMIQLRDKQADTRVMIETGRALKRALAGTHALLVINDDVEAAIAVEADGLHVGQSDMGAHAARQRIGNRMILGISVETVERARAVDAGVINYVGAGPVFATSTKPDHEPPTGFGGLKRIVEASQLPVVAIGGLKAEHAGACFAAGAHGMAVVSAICGTPDPEAATRNIARAIAEARETQR